MNYTINKLARLSGVSVRTLRFYDEIGLLKPAYVAENRYRYYQEAQLLRLQQILFFRELGFELKQIQDILEQSDFNRIHVLRSHKKVLHNEIQKMKKLLCTIDRTINHLQGNYKMTEKEIFYGFSKEKQAEYEQYLVQRLGANRPEFAECARNVKNWTKEDWLKHQTTGEELNKAFVEALEKGLKPDSVEVQMLVRKHFELIKLFWTPTQETYRDLGQLYLEHPDFRVYYAAYHSELAQFLADAMKVFAERGL